MAKWRLSDSTIGIGEEVVEKMKLESLIKIGTNWAIIEAGSMTQLEEITVMSLRTLLYSCVNSSGEPLKRSWKEDKLWKEGTEGLWRVEPSISI